MDSPKLKMVWFDLYCQYCKYHDNSENDPPCEECLENPFNEDSHKPVKFEDKDGKDKS